MNTQLMTLGFSSEDERSTNLRRGLAWVLDTNIAQCQWQYPLITLLPQSCLLSIVAFANSKNQPWQRGVPLDYIPRSKLVQEDSKMAEFIDRMSQVSLRKT